MCQAKISRVDYQVPHSRCFKAYISWTKGGMRCIISAFVAMGPSADDIGHATMSPCDADSLGMLNLLEDLARVRQTLSPAISTLSALLPSPITKLQIQTSSQSLFLDGDFEEEAFWIADNLCAITPSFSPPTH